MRPRVGAITVRLTPYEHDLVVLDSDDAHGCAPTRCLGASQAVGLAAETVTLTAAAGHSVYLVVDGHGAPGGAYGLTVECARP